ncbi:prolyl oligopeptidase family serine peptidase [Streptomyces sp. SID3343]|uniref:prolyl oligopeptidase family serine peptidase n=1 Tax=Streptomyces sp. SID3343 TaxID=2690260 RepID=UPI001371CAD5|nr:prolyl oligopeptidase family serine peptidase [Streptomyces sp. SID3343]MYV99576.1 prolyl oligopeptidase family serine peptidase [Streptomyces sp. SID3343]
MTRPVQPVEDAPRRTSPDLVAARGDTADVLFGHRVADPYRALEDADSATTRAWSAAQDEAFRAHVGRLAGRDRLRARLTELLATGLTGLPCWRGERHFVVRRDPGREHAVLFVVEADGAERALVDPIAIDASGTTTLDRWVPSDEGDLLAYLLSTGGDEESRLYVLDVATGAPVEGPIDRVRDTSIGWLPGGSAFYLVRRLSPEQAPAGEEQHHRRVYLHRVGTDPAGDVEVFGTGSGAGTYFGVGVSHDGHWLTVSASLGTAPRNDVWLADLRAGDPARPVFRPVAVGLDALTEVRVGRDGRLYVLTDLDAPRGRLCVGDPAAPEPEGWRDLVAEESDAVLSGYAILDGDGVERPVLVVTRTRHAVGEVSVCDLASGAVSARLPMPGGSPGSVGAPTERPEGGYEAWFGWSDYSAPSAVLRYDARTGAIDTWAASPGTAELPRVHVHQESYTSADGATVRMFVIAPTAAPDRPRPAVLYGYGGFGVSLGPAYSAGALAWVEAGGVYAIANLRGGGEEGEDWHRAGMRGHKQRVFDDFHAAAEHLTARGWSAPDRLAASGGSNGGLLVGAALTQRPELYAAVACSMPLLDMVRYERFGLGRLWSDEYGSAAVAEELAWLLGYSPYHHVREGVDYPAVLFTVFDGDTRVDPLHARKMCAALRHAAGGDRPILLRAEAQVGHAARSVTRTVELSVDTLAFLAHWTGLDLAEGVDGAADAAPASVASVASAAPVAPGPRRSGEGSDR